MSGSNSSGKPKARKAPSNFKLIFIPQNSRISRLEITSYQRAINHKHLNQFLPSLSYLSTVISPSTGNFFPPSLPLASGKFPEETFFWPLSFPLACAFLSFASSSSRLRHSDKPINPYFLSSNFQIFGSSILIIECLKINKGLLWISTIKQNFPMSLY